MNVFLIGATGYVGTAVDHAFAARGHHVTAAARSESARSKLQARGTTHVRADAADPSSLPAHVKAADVVVYATNVTDADPLKVDSAAIRAIVKTMAGTEKALIYVSTALVYGSTGPGPVAEDAELAPPAIAVRRPDFERYVLGTVNFGIRAFVVRPGFAYGRGGGTAAMFSAAARERGTATIVGDGENRWSTVHVDDLGRLVVLVAERGRPGTIYNATDGSTYTMREIAEAAVRGAGGKGTIVAVAPGLLGPFGEALTLDQHLDAARAKRELGWQAAEASIVDELERAVDPTPALAS